MALAGLPAQSRAAFEETLFLRIATGPPAGTYFPVGGVMATAISNPPGTRECQRGGICGVPGLISVAISSQGSVENVESIGSGVMESAYCQSDVAFWAYNGSDLLPGMESVASLRSVTTLFQEAIHLVVAANRGIWRVQDLKGRRIAIDQRGSGTQVEARLVLDELDFADDVEMLELSPSAAADALTAGEIDGFFLVSGAPAPVIAQLAERSLVTLLPLEGEVAEALRNRNSFLKDMTIPSGTYFNVPLTKTLSVGCQWLVSADIADDVVYEIVDALWDRRIRKLIKAGHAQGAEIKLRRALEEVTEPPLHPGAERYYQEQGFIWMTLRDQQG